MKTKPLKAWPPDWIETKRELALIRYELALIRYGLLIGKYPDLPRRKG